MPVTLCAVQLAPELGRAESNARLVADETAAAADEGADLIVFPEAALTGYVFESRPEALAAAVAADGPELGVVAAAAGAAGAWVVCGAIERDGDALYNTAFLVGPEGPVGRYRKAHTLCLGADRFTRPGGEPFRVFDLPFGRIGLHICYDGSFPEPARALRLLGAQLLLLPTNWPRLVMKREVVRVRAYENRAFFMAVNRVGTERGVRFEGGSCAADPDGRLILDAGDEAGRFHVTVDPAAAADSREVVIPGEYELDLIQDRRPELYEPIARPTPEARRTGSRAAD